MKPGHWHQCQNPLSKNNDPINGWKIKKNVKNWQWCGDAYNWSRLTQDSCVNSSMSGQWITEGMIQSASNPYYDFSNNCGITSKATKYNP